MHIDRIIGYDHGYAVYMSDSDPYANFDGYELPNGEIILY